MTDRITELALHIDNLDGSSGSFIYGGQGTPRGGLNTISPHETTSLQIIIQNSVVIIIVIAIVLSLSFLIWGGIQWITSQGDKHKLDQAKARITYAIIGLLVIFFSYFIVRLVGSLFGIDVLCVTSACKL